MTTFDVAYATRMGSFLSLRVAYSPPSPSQPLYRVPGPSFSSYKIHARGTNCEDVIPEIAFGATMRTPYSFSRRRKTEENARPERRRSLPSFLLLTLFDPSCRSFCRLSCTHFAKIYRSRPQPEFPSSYPRPPRGHMRNSACTGTLRLA